MTLLEAIQNCGENWFRPVGWSNSGEAFSLRGDGQIICNYSDGGIKVWIPAHTRWILSDWEIVTPEKVIGER